MAGQEKQFENKVRGNLEKFRDGVYYLKFRDTLE